MFDGLSSRLSGILDKLKGRGVLSEADVGEAMREVRRALLEGDVALVVVKSFVDRVRERAVGAEVLKSVTPGQMVVKIVHDELVAILGSDQQGIDLDAPAPVAIMLVGLQGSGKTTTCAKIAVRIRDRSKKKVLMASLDVRRPAAQEQLRVLGEANGIDTLPIVAGQMPTQITARALQAARLGGFDVVLLDTAGRTTLDEAMMLEAIEVRAAARPHETLLVADSLTGQDAVNTARAFEERVGLTGIVLTRADGDGRGGAALSMRAVTGKPIKLLGVGEKVDALEEFHPTRVANRILGMGDIVGLVERAAESIDRDKAQAMAERMAQGRFTLDDLADQLRQMQKLGGLGGLMGMLPGVGKAKDQMAAAGMDDRLIKRMVAVTTSMTAEERAKPDKVLTFSRKKRIAKGSGTSLEEINKVLKMHRGMADMMKDMARNKKGGLAGLFGGMFGGGGAAAPSPDQIAQLQKSLPTNLPKGFTPPGGMPGLGGPKLPGLGGPKLPGLGGPSLPGLPKGPFDPTKR